MTQIVHRIRKSLLNVEAKGTHEIYLTHINLWWHQHTQNVMKDIQNTNGISQQVSHISSGYALLVEDHRHGRIVIVIGTNGFVSIVM